MKVKLWGQMENLTLKKTDRMRIEKSLPCRGLMGKRGGGGASQSHPGHLEDAATWDLYWRLM